MQNNVPSFWSDVRVDYLKTMWSAGRSGGEIASSLGVTRCSVLGKIFRLRLPVRAIENNKRYKKRTPEQIAAKRAKDKRGNEKRRAKQVAVKPKLTITNLEALRCVEVEPLGKTLLELGPNECRYPYGDGAPYSFCGRPQFNGSSYCGGHFGLTARRGRHE